MSTMFALFAMSAFAGSVVAFGRDALSGPRLLIAQETINTGGRHPASKCFSLHATDKNGDFAALSTRAKFCKDTAKLIGASLSLSIAVASKPLTDQANAMATDPKTGIALPEVGEIESAVPTDWSTVDNPATSSNGFGRLDSTPDSIFYSDPRFVEHVDEQAVKSMTSYISKDAIPKATQNDGSVAVLDLCASWTSHIEIDQNQSTRISGLGMNAKELDKNPILNDWVVKDLNKNPTLPYEDSTFDIVLCQLSIDYLTQPLQVLKEVGRVLRPNGTVHIIFSNRLFLSKVRPKLLLCGILCYVCMSHTTCANCELHPHPTNCLHLCFFSIRKHHDPFPLGCCIVDWSRRH